MVHQQDLLQGANLQLRGRLRMKVRWSCLLSGPPLLVQCNFGTFLNCGGRWGGEGEHNLWLCREISRHMVSMGMEYNYLHPFLDAVLTFCLLLYAVAFL